MIRTVGASGALRQHFLDMGMIPGAEVTVVKFAPMGDPMELQVHGYDLTLSLAEAEQIEVEENSERTNLLRNGFVWRDPMKRSYKSTILIWCNGSAGLTQGLLPNRIRFTFFPVF